MKICFFTTTQFELVKNESYTFNDYNFLKNKYDNVVFASKFGDIPWDCDLYFSWWLSGSFYPLVVAKILRKPIIVVAGGNEAQIVYDKLYKKFYGYKNAPIYKRIATNLVSRYATEVIAVSKYLQTGYQSLFKRHCKLIYNGVDTYRFRLPISAVKAIHITFISSTEKNTAELKRLPVFLKAISLLPHHFRCPVLILGKIGDYHSFYVNLCKEYEIEDVVSFIGHVDVDKMATFFQSSKLFVQISEVETFGLAVAEALSCGIPVLVSKNGALPEIVANNGVYVDHNCPNSVVEGIIKVLSSSEINDLSAMERRHNYIKDNFSMDSRFRMIDKLIKTVTNS